MQCPDDEDGRIDLLRTSDTVDSYASQTFTKPFLKGGSLNAFLMSLSRTRIIMPVNLML